MSDFAAILKRLRRPRLLISAARHGLPDYNREMHLGRLVQTPRAPASDLAVPLLLAAEASCEELRRLGDASYSALRHIELLVALIAEVHLVPRTVQAG